MLALYVNIYEIFTVQMCMTLTLTFRMGQGQMYVFQRKGPLRRPMCWRLQALSYLSTFATGNSRDVHNLDL